MQDAGMRYNDVPAAALSIRPAGQRLDLVCVGDVCLDEDGFTAGLFDHLHRLLASSHNDITTFAPSSAKASAVLRPIPELPPVTRATLFLNIFCTVYAPLFVSVFAAAYYNRLVGDRLESQLRESRSMS